MSGKSFAEQLNDAQVMGSGLTNNAEEAARFGWPVEKTTLLNSNRTDIETLNDEQEKLKADLKRKTAELDTKMAELQNLMCDAKKTVKLAFPLEQWKEFGVTDKR